MKISKRCSRSKISATSVLLALAGLLLTGAMSFAQLPTGTILGTVKDTSGAIVPEAKLTAKNTETGLTRSATSGGDGAYRFQAMPVGTYEISLEHPGFQTEIKKGLVLTVGQEAVVNFSLEVGAVEQTIAVTAEAPLVNTTSGSLGGLVSEQKISDLPLNGRNYADLTLLQTGITQHRNYSMAGAETGVMFSSNGATLHSNNFMLDGAIMHSWFGVTSASMSNSTLGVEGMREWRMVTNAFSAEYGMSMGSQMTIVTKSGTNSFHGSAFEFLRNSAMDARNFFDRKTAVSTDRIPPFKRNNFGGSFGGPVKRDKDFFFVTYETVKQRLGATVLTNTIPASFHGDPSALPLIKPILELFPLPNVGASQFTFPFTTRNDEHYGQARVDHTFNANDSFFVRYTIDQTDVIFNSAYPQFPSVYSSRSQYATISENHVFNSSLLNTARFSYSRPKLFADAPTSVIGPQYSFVTGRPIGVVTIGGVDALGPLGTAPNAKVENIFTWGDDLFLSKGRHSLKFGTMINGWQIFSLNGTNTKGQATFPSIQAFLAATPSNIQAVTPGSVLDRLYGYKTYGFYGQDDLRVSPRLTLNLGLRYEFITTLTELHGHGAALRDIQHDSATTLGKPFANPSLKNYSPRFGFAWDVNGDGKTAIRGGYALLYDISNQAGGLSAGVGATPPYSNFTSVASPGPLTLPFVFPAGTAGKTLRVPDYNFKQPYMHQYSLTVERQLPGGMALTATYSGSRGIHLLDVVDGNPKVPQILPDNRQFWGTSTPFSNPNWGSIEWYTSAGNSWYNSAQFSLNKRASHGLQFQASYTYSKLLDLPQSQAITENLSTSSWSSNPSRPFSDKGPAAFDLTHNFRFNTIYQIPNLGSHGIVKSLMSGWWASGILTLQGGYPFTPALAGNRSRSGVGSGAASIDRPDLVPGTKFSDVTSGTSKGCGDPTKAGFVAPGRKLGTPDIYFDPCAFTVPAVGFMGSAGRDILRGPKFADVDISLVKDTALKYLGEGGKLQFRAEFFNLLNHANMGLANRNVFSASPATTTAENPLSTAGTITNTIGTSRQIQLALKILF